ncbi:MAG: thioredoxin family protein [Actinomycetota bacterium]|nr:thioredoxin family protein [Actinomycetota bacterium]
MSRLIVAAALVLVAGIVAGALRRRKPEPPTQTRWAVPAQLDRADFEHPDAGWLVVVFSSTTCAGCDEAVAKASVLASPEVAVQEASYQGRPDLHKRYAIEAAPTIVVADADGVVRASFVSTPTATDLWAAVAEVRFPGTTPAECPAQLDGHPPDGHPPCAHPPEGGSGGD